MHRKNLDIFDALQLKTSVYRRASTVKTSSVIKAHLLRAALYPLLLSAVCLVPFALAQQPAAERSRASAASPFFASSNAAAAPVIGVSLVPSVPPAPAIILYDQIDNPAPTPTPPMPGGVTSQDFEPARDNFDSFAADDFLIPTGQTWNITEVDVIGESSEPPAPPDSFHVFFYADSAALPGTLVASRLANPYSGFGEFVITLTSPVTLSEGAYWVSVQAREDFSASGAWFWDNRLVISNTGAAWQNPGGGFGMGCLTWGRKTTCLPTQNGPDQLFRLVGTVGAGPRPTPTPHSRPTPAPRPHAITDR